MVDITSINSLNNWLIKELTNTGPQVQIPNSMYNLTEKILSMCGNEHGSFDDDNNSEIFEIFVMDFLVDQLERRNRRLVGTGLLRFLMSVYGNLRRGESIDEFGCIVIAQKVLGISERDLISKFAKSEVCLTSSKKFEKRHKVSMRIFVEISEDTDYGNMFVCD